MAEGSSGSTTGIVAIVAIVLLVLVGFLVIRGGLMRRSGDSGGGDFSGKVQIEVPKTGEPAR